MKTNFLASSTLAAVLLATTSQVAAATNTKYGASALYHTTTGAYDSAFGYYALFYNTSGSNLTAAGYQALLFNTTGQAGTAIGSSALRGSSKAANYYNTALGSQALYSTTTGSYGTAIGERALYANTTGTGNTAFGYVALRSNTMGNYNVASGSGALYANLTAHENVSIGKDSLKSNTSGSYNTVIGAAAHQAGTTGGSNTAHGLLCLQTVTGYQNTGFGAQVLSGGRGGARNTGIGAQALWSCTGSDNIAIGEVSGYYLSTGSNNIVIGNYGRAGDASTIRIGEPGYQASAIITGIHGVTVANGVRVRVNADGRLGTLTSSRRFKESITDMGAASSCLRKLRPVTFHYTSELDSERVPQFGLIAEETAEVLPDLVAHDSHGGIHTVRYEAVNAMLLNEFQKQHQRVKAQGAKKAQMEQRLAVQRKLLGSQQEELEELRRRVGELTERMKAQARNAE